MRSKVDSYALHLSIFTVDNYLTLGVQLICKSKTRRQHVKQNNNRHTGSKRTQTTIA